MSRIKKYLKENKEQLKKRCKTFLWNMAGMSVIFLLGLLQNFIDQEYKEEVFITLMVGNLATQVTKFFNRKNVEIIEEK